MTNSTLNCITLLSIPIKQMKNREILKDLDVQTKK